MPVSTGSPCRSRLLRRFRPQPPRVGRGRVRAGGADLLRAAVRDHRNRAGVLRRAGAGDRHAGLRRADPDRPGAEGRFDARRSSRPKSATRSSRCSTAPASMSMCRAIRQEIVVKITDPIDASGNFVNNMVYSPGASSDDIVVVRAFYQWPLFVTGLGYNIANIGRGTQQQTAAGRDRCAVRNRTWIDLIKFLLAKISLLRSAMARASARHAAALPRSNSP